MALKPFRSIDYKAFMNGTTYDIGSGSNQERFTSSGEGPVVDGVNLVYWDNLDLIVGEMGEDSTSTKYTTWHDPLVVDVTGPKVKSIARAGVARGFVGGEWNRIAGTQRFYTWGAGGSAGKLIEIEDLVNWSFDTAKASAHTDNIVRDGTNTAIASSTIGFMSNAGTDGASPYGRVFETWGYLLRPGYCKHTDGNTYHGLCLQDITAAGTNPPPGQPTGTSGLGTLIDGGITRYTTTPNNPIDGTEFETGTFLADSFTMAGMQFVPDDDDTPQRPKGFLVLFSKAFDNTGSVTNQWYQYVKFLDFNPFAKSAKPGSPSRIHMRQTLFSRIEYLMNEAPATSANSSGRELVSPPAETLMQYPMYLPNSRKLVTIFDHLIGNDSAGSDIAWVEWGITPEITQIQPPTNITSVKTAKTVQWSGKAVGSIGEGVPNIEMTWSLQRISTIREALDTSFGASPSGATATVAYPPIDPDTLVVEFTDDAGATYSTLVEGASDDYTVDEATGIITWGPNITGASPAGPETSGYVASYKHEENPTTPAHGTLLQTISTTDNTGQAQTRVRYPDDDTLVGEYDRINASVTDD